MAMLLFKKVFYDAIRTGRKTTTLRRWTRRLVKPGQVVTAPHVGKLLIEAADEVELAQLTEADAHADGFDSLAALRKTLREIYPHSGSDGGAWYRIAFRLQESTPQLGKPHGGNPHPEKPHRAKRTAQSEAPPRKPARAGAKLASVERESSAASSIDRRNKRELATMLRSELDKLIR